MDGKPSRLETVGSHTWLENLPQKKKELFFSQKPCWATQTCWWCSGHMVHTGGISGPAFMAGTSHSWHSGGTNPPMADHTWHKLAASQSYATRLMNSGSWCSGPSGAGASWEWPWAGPWSWQSLASWWTSSPWSSWWQWSSWPSWSSYGPWWLCSWPWPSSPWMALFKVDSTSGSYGDLGCWDGYPAEKKMKADNVIWSNCWIKSWQPKPWEAMMAFKKMLQKQMNTISWKHTVATTRNGKPWRLVTMGSHSGLNKCAWHEWAAMHGLEPAESLFGRQVLHHNWCVSPIWWPTTTLAGTSHTWIWQRHWLEAWEAIRLAIKQNVFFSWQMPTT